MGLFSSLFSREPKVARLKEDANVEGLIKALSYKDKAVRERAAQYLVDVFEDAPAIVAKSLKNNPQLIDRLITASRDEDATVRWGAVFIMGFLLNLDDRVTEPVIAAVKDRDYRVRRVSVRHLGSTNDPRFYELLIAAGRRETNPEILEAILEYSGRLLGALEAEQALAEPRKARKSEDVGSPVLEPKMILIPAGEFLMGSDLSVDKDTLLDEQPQHTVYLPDYYIAKIPVTNAHYAAFVQATGHRQPQHWKGEKPPRGKEDHPVEWVSWHDAIAYCKWLAETTRKPYRLPSEAEWEKGARGSDGRIYPWGNRWFWKGRNTSGGEGGGTVPVGAYPQGASPYGLLHMAGNVWEWCSSLIRDYPYNSDDGREDLEADEVRALRGSAYIGGQLYDRCAYRHGMIHGERCWGVGFRMVVSSSSP